MNNNLIGYKSLKECVYDYLRKELENGGLKPGDTIDEKSLSEKLNVSRTPIREAVIQLEVEGFVSILPRRRIYVNELKEKEGYRPDAVMLLYITSPLREARHIQKAVDTLQIFKCDSVVSVYEDNSYLYRRGKYGLRPVVKERKLRLQREIFYADNGAIMLSWTNAISPESFTFVR